jgi:hypothetical protein
MSGLENEFPGTARDKYGAFIRTALPGEVLCVDELRHIDTKAQWMRSRWVAYCPVTELL